MKQLLKFILPLFVVGLMFSCTKEDIRPKEDSNNCTCQSGVDGKSGSSNGCNTLNGDNGEPPITDPNNDEDENKVIRKTSKS